MSEKKTGVEISTLRKRVRGDRATVVASAMAAMETKERRHVSNNAVFESQSGFFSQYLVIKL